MKKSVDNNLCCRLGEEYLIHPHVIHETKSFFVIPTLGQMGIEGYLLICSKEHLEGSRELSDRHLIELENLVTKLKYALVTLYSQKIILFENSPKTTGDCLNHFHAHLLPLKEEIDFKRKFHDSGLKKLDVDGISHMKNISKEHSFYMESPPCDKGIYYLDKPIASQFVRRFISQELGLGEWNWKEMQNRSDPMYLRTTERLKDFFDDEVDL